MSTESERIFIALPLPSPVRAVLQTLEQPLAGVRWTPPEQWHVTLRFLGDVPANLLAKSWSAFPRWS